MKFYTVATKGSDKAMGADLQYLHITPTGPYNTGEFPKLYKNESAAEEAALKTHKGIVVCLLVSDD